MSSDPLELQVKLAYPGQAWDGALAARLPRRNGEIPLGDGAVLRFRGYEPPSRGGPDTGELIFFVLGIPAGVASNFIASALADLFRKLRPENSFTVTVTAERDGGGRVEAQYRGVSDDLDRLTAVLDSVRKPSP
ncbi:hypothetical protein [Cryptosporangium sp. NPDC051539]|uniref:hypothetical protein n=1 Tax=Cryptosporangium sp. NPDC051539 TaxID=3363962 RepID=UPI00378EC3B2